jgi:hypothetical protein
MESLHDSEIAPGDPEPFVVQASACSAAAPSLRASRQPEGCTTNRRFMESIGNHPVSLVFILAMADSNSGKKPRILFWLLVGALLFMSMFILNSNRPRKRYSPKNACINNLRRIDGVKQQWAIEHGKSPADSVTWEDITPYFRAGGKITNCPAGGRYSLGLAVSNDTTCSVPNHVLPEWPANDSLQKPPQ